MRTVKKQNTESTERCERLRQVLVAFRRKDGTSWEAFAAVCDFARLVFREYTLVLVESIVSGDYIEALHGWKKWLASHKRLSEVAFFETDLKGDMWVRRFVNWSARYADLRAHEGARICNARAGWGTWAMKEAVEGARNFARDNTRNRDATARRALELVKYLRIGLQRETGSGDGRQPIMESEWEQREACMKDALTLEFPRVLYVDPGGGVQSAVEGAEV
jgi:hypothetical protein